MNNNGPTNIFDYRHHIPSNITISDALHTITHRGKNDDYDWLSQHGAHVAQCDAWRNEIFAYMYRVITNKEYMIWYMSITCRVITPNLEQVPQPSYM